MSGSGFYWAWLISIVVSFTGSGLWFGPKTFFPVWWKEMGRSPDEKPGTDNMAQVFGLTFLGVVIQTFVLGWAMERMSVQTWVDGAQVGAILGTGLAAFTSLGHRLFAENNLKVWLIEVGADVLTLTLAGAIFGHFFADAGLQ